MHKPDYYLSKDDGFVIENYDHAPTFSSFFPGISGLYGTPMWVFYANRGQCITSFGMHDKDGSIMEFFPANKAYRTAALTGFRTFIKVDGVFYEPFNVNFENKNEMRISSYDLHLIEECKSHKIHVEVKYFSLPNESFPALVRMVKIKNTSPKKRRIEILDGMPAIIPNGFSNSLLKNISQTIEAWAITENMENNAPFFRLQVVPSDAPETKLNKRGNFYCSFAYQAGKGSKTRVLVNSKTVFGDVTSLQYPENFINKKFILPQNEVHDGFINCAFSYKETTLKKNEEVFIISLIGNIDSIEKLNGKLPIILTKEFIDGKYEQNMEIINEITNRMSIETSSREFDMYSRQSFLDNVMRGGLPFTLGNKVLYTYYRKHGDMERDYNDFKFLPTYFSQGSGNFRDINQNRRCDIFFNKDIGDTNIVRFFNLIQLDGYNPLVVLGSRFYVPTKESSESLVNEHIKNPSKKTADLLTKAFILGDIIKLFEETGIEYTTSREAFVSALMERSEVIEEATHGEGFWTDHFFYNIDLLESFECIFPEKVQELLFHRKVFNFFDNENIVLDRANKYFVREGQVRQYKSVKMDQEKRSLIASRPWAKNMVRVDMGKGAIYNSTLITKLLCIVANKAASFDAEGIGIEMEAEKPDWYDALNGLPSLFGSSLSETLELKRLCVWIALHVKADDKASIPVEIKELMDGILSETKRYIESKDSFACWDASSSLKEIYRNKVKLGITGEEVSVDGGYLNGFAGLITKKCDIGIKKCLSKYKNYYTYFINKAVDFESTSPSSVKVKKFEQEHLPLFLEGFVHALKVENDLKIPDMVKQSELFDKKLKMYKVNASLKDVPIEVGRAKVFLPGWLENESVWLHMEYKYMLELLKAGLYKEFFGSFKDVIVPFMDPKIYKRSTLENSSFIVSSAYPEPQRHGRGFVARLSGATAEFTEMWIRMTCGHRIFSLDKDGKLMFKLEPVLPKWLFKQDKLTFRLFSATDVTYINKKKKDTFDSGVQPVSYKIVYEDKEIDIKGPVVNEPHASLIRNCKAKKIIVTLD